MKILKISAVIIGTLLVVFFLVGVFFPQFEYQGHVTVKATAAKSWQVFNDTTLHKKWIEGFKSLTLKEGSALQPNAVYEIVIADNSEVYVMKEKIISIAPPSFVSFELTNEVMQSAYDFSFVEGSDGTTEITSRYTVTGNNLLWRSVLFISKSYLRSSNQQQLEALKKVIEQQP